MQVILRALNRWTVLAAILLGTLFAINSRVDQIASTGANPTIFAAASMPASASHPAHGKNTPH
ncbi:MAG: hypothetical protein HKL92_08145 [Candidatus Eremiobacteraeota bacterium]|nr:hypothetical protein [Candidatus Eremiobacteraeota bacterium]NNM93297.1 hypothetical protein [Candidatus Eremiobacteraeota bacterium]